VPAEDLVRDALLAPEFLPCSLDAATRFAVALRSLILGRGLAGVLAFFAADFFAAVFFEAVFFEAVFFEAVFFEAVFLAGVRFVGIVIT